MTFRLLHESSEFVAVDKPWGMPVIPGREGPRGDSVREQLEKQLGRPVWVVHRLDRDTSGVLLFALSAQAHKTLNVAFDSREVKKKYWALVDGRLEREVTVDVALVEARRSRMRVAREGEAGKAAQTVVRPVEVFEKTSWVEAEPLTGRTHQIRVHLAHLGHPLLVDHQYGRREPFAVGEVRLERTPLHAAKLSLVFNGANVAIESALPSDMRAVIDALGKLPFR